MPYAGEYYPVSSKTIKLCSRVSYLDVSAQSLLTQGSVLVGLLQRKAIGVLQYATLCAGSMTWYVASRFQIQ
jgi:hypothetical protein